MQKLFYQPPGHWFGDCMPFADNGRYYVFHQRDDRSMGPLGAPFGWSLATTTDFVNYDDKGIAIPRGGNDEQDQSIWAGSIFKAQDGVYHAFYTGFNYTFEAQGKPAQVLMHAVSDDLLNWTKTQDALTFTPQPGYDPHDWRDPFVIWNEEKGEYLLILGGRKQGPKTCMTGRTVYFTSKDLAEWTFGGDFWAPDIFTMHEMPDLFKLGDWWYHIISEYSDKNKIVYRMAKSLDGPWTAPVDDAFDGRAYYAGRTAVVGGQRILFGWVPTREDDDDKKNFEWGGVFVAHEVYQRPDGTLGVKIPDTVWQAFQAPGAAVNERLATVDSRKALTLAEDCGDIFRLEADIAVGENTRSFGVRFYENEETGECYQYIFHVGENRYVFEKAPNKPWFQCMNIGLERPLFLQPGKTYHLQMIVDDTIATLYIDGVALSARMYTRPGSGMSMFVTDGELEIGNAAVANGLK